MKTKVIIDRGIWRTGGVGEYQTGDGITQLLNNRGYMCCLCFICSTFLPKEKIRDICIPQELEIIIPELTTKEESCINDTSLTNKAVCINDDDELKPEDREMKLLELFKESCYELEFVGKYI